MTNCSANNLSESFLTEQEVRIYLITSSAALGLAATLCLIAVVLVIVVNLLKNLVYRLSLYQVFSTLTFEILWVIYLAERDKGPVIRGLFAVLSGCSAMVTLMTSTWIVVHLFALAVCNKNLKHLEPLYVTSTILVPLSAAGIILVTLYATNGTSKCLNAYAIGIEWIAGFATGCAILVLDCFLVFVMGAILCFRAFRRIRRVFTQPDPKDRKLFFEMVPLLVYPVLLLLILSPILIDLMVNNAINYAFVIFASSLSILTSLTLITHVSIVLWNKRQRMSARGESVLTTSNAALEECSSLRGGSLASDSNVLLYHSIPVRETTKPI